MIGVKGRGLLCFLLVQLLLGVQQWSKVHADSNNFLDWLVECGATGIGEPSAALEMVTFWENGTVVKGPSEKMEGVVRQLRTRKPVFANNLLFSIPYDCCIRDSAGEPLPGKLASAPWDVRLATRLLLKRAQGKELQSNHPHVQLHLESTVTTAWLFSPQEREELQYKVTLDDVEERRESVRRAFDEFGIADATGADYAAFEWAMAVTTSRYVVLTPGVRNPKGAVNVTRALVPFLDVAGADFGGQLEYRAEEDRVEVITTQAVRPGKQVRLSFNAAGLEHLVLQLGFVVEHSPHESFAIFNTLEEATRWYLERYGTLSCHTREQLQAATPSNAKILARALADVSDKTSGLSFEEWTKGWWPADSEQALRMEHRRIMVWEDGGLDKKLVEAYGRFWEGGHAEGYCQWLGKEDGERVDVGGEGREVGGGSKEVEEAREGQVRYSPRGKFEAPRFAALVRCEEILNSFPTSTLEDKLALAMGEEGGEDEEEEEDNEMDGLDDWVDEAQGGQCGQGEGEGYGDHLVCRGWKGKKDAAILTKNMKLAVRYRLRKKEALVQAIHFMHRDLRFDFSKYSYSWNEPEESELVEDTKEEECKFGDEAKGGECKASQENVKDEL